MNLIMELYEEASIPSDAHVRTKRSEPRRVIREDLDLEIDGKLVRFTAVAYNVGTNTIGIISKIPIQVRSRIRVRRASTEGPWNEAIVVHCTDTIGGHKIGLEIVED